MVTVTDLYASDFMHIEINAFFLRIYREYLKQEIHLFAERRHVEALARAVPIDETHCFGSFRTIFQWHASRVLLREFLTIFRVLRVVLHARQNRSTLLHVLCASHFAHIVLRLVLKVIPVGCPVVLSIHSELESLARPERRFWLPQFWFPKSLGIPTKNLYPLVLAKNIVCEAERRKISTANWIAIEHPYTFPEIAEKHSAKSGCFIVGAIGAASLSRGTHQIFELAERFKEDITNGRFRFQIIGKVFPPLEQHITAAVEVPKRNGFSDKDEFDKAVNALDAVLFFCPCDSYQLTASGSIFDAVRYNKPIIAYENAYFRWLRRLVRDEQFSLVRNLDDFEQILRKWQRNGSTPSNSAYEQLKSTHSVTEVTRDFLRQLSQKTNVQSKSALRPLKDEN